jgi:glycosyltransferase involved in cell wall biosynthesis
VLCVVPLFKLLRAKRVLASWAFPDALACAWLKPLAGYQLYIQCLGSDINVHQHHPRRRAMLAAAFARANAVITVSKDLAQKAQQISPSADVITIYNGVNFERFALQKQPPADKSLIFIGNLIKTKGVFELLRAIQLLNDPAIRLHMVGGGPEAQALQQQAAQFGIADQVQFYGRLPHQQVSELLQHSQLLVLPSYSEGVPNVIMEALACGIPVVATSVGGIPEVVSKHSGVLLADYQPATIAAGIEFAWLQPWQPAQIRQSIAHHTWQANSTQLYTLIEHGREQCSALQHMDTPHD